jgi:hypothetical protein
MTSTSREEMSHCVYHNFKHSAEEGSVIVFHVQQDNDLWFRMVDRFSITDTVTRYRVMALKATRAFLKEINQNQVR